MFCCDLTFVFRVGELTTPEVISASTEIPLLPPMPPRSPNPVSVYDIPLRKFYSFTSFDVPYIPQNLRSLLQVVSFWRFSSL